MSMGSRTSQMVPDGLQKIPNRPKFNLRSFFDADLACMRKKVSRSVKEGHGRVPEHREDMPKHPEFLNSPGLR